MNPNKDLSDIEQGDWVERLLPTSWQPYARLCRLDRPVGTWLTVLPALAALFMAAGGWPELPRVLVFCLGALLMRSAGCTINDIWDRDFDRHVERTRHRPLTSGRITLRQAVLFLLAQLAAAALLLFFINAQSRWLALVLVPLVIVYPLCKRFTCWPQLVLSLAFNWGILMAWSDTQNQLPAEAFLMWLGAVFWQMGYDTIYAYADLEDDQKLNLKSTAVRFADKGRLWLSGFYALTVLCWFAAGVLGRLHWLSGTALAVIALLLVQQLRSFDIHKRALSFQLFKSNIWVGLALLIGAMAGTLL